LQDDQHALFGRTPSTKAQFSAVPLARVLEHFGAPEFLEHELPKISIVGFARFRPELSRAKIAYSRGHVYAALLINVERVLRVKQANFKQELFIWEDLSLNIDAHDICKCFRFAMIKKRFTAGGCTAQLARTATPHFKCVCPTKLAVRTLVAEALGQQPGAGRGRGRGRGRGARAEPGGPAPEQLALVPVRDALDIERDREFAPGGAITDLDGNVQFLYYKAFIQAFKDKEIALADPAAPTGFKALPGMRTGEDRPCGLRLWDDTRGRRAKAGTKAKWGAGWIASVGPKKSRWFNIRVWGSWRLAFVLARLQLEVWKARGETPMGSEKAVAKRAAGLAKNARPGHVRLRREKRGGAKPEAPKLHGAEKRGKVNMDSKEKKAKKKEKKKEKKDKKDKKEKKGNGVVEKGPSIDALLGAKRPRADKAGAIVGPILQLLGAQPPGAKSSRPLPPPQSALPVSAPRDDQDLEELE